mgnify:CR=1 FL=1|jgi:hypothetical protein
MEQIELDDLMVDADDYLRWVGSYDVPNELPICEDSCLGDDLTPQRIKELENGAEPTESEGKLLLNHWLLRLLDPFNDGPPPVKCMTFVEPNPEKHLNEWLIIQTTGTSFEGIHSKVYGRFKTKEMAIASLCEDGFLEGHI